MNNRGWWSVVLLLTASAAWGQGTKEDYERADRLSALTAGKVFKLRVRPTWFADGNRFWYRNDLKDGGREFVVVDAQKGTREPAFDHAKLADALARVTGKKVAAARLPMDALSFDDKATVVRFRAEGKRWEWSRDNQELKELGKDDAPPASLSVLPEPHPSRRTGDATSITFVNRTGGAVDVFWINPDGERVKYAAIEDGKEYQQNTYAGHVWVVVNGQGRDVAAFEGDEQPGRAVLGPDLKPLEPTTRRPERSESPDGKWVAFVKDFNVALREKGSGMEFVLSRDGTKDDAYEGRFFWSPDSAKLVALRTKAAQEHKVFIVESSPKDQVQPKLISYDYLKPGDRLAVSKPHLFDVGTRKEVAVGDELFANPWSVENVRWRPDSSRFTFLYNQRGHQVMRVVAVDTATGSARAVIDEQCPTFFCYSSKEYTRHIDETNEILWMSERDGWNHLYLYDAATGKVKNQVTKGEWIVRGVDRVDEKERQIWFRAGGLDPHQDPYHVHFCRINFDGTGLVRLTEGDGTHAVAYSPDRRFLIDTYSRVDLPPVTELRRAHDGKLVCELETADASALAATGWRTPERFVAKGRDGKTDIWGVIYRPTTFDLKKKYPVIESIYAGPHDSHVPKEFRPMYGPQVLAELGFITVQIDGMGTSNRSKAFHDVCWKNLGDAGFPDRIRWLKAAAEKYPYMDLSRVGIYGGSAGGQNSTRAVLAHPEFYKVAVSDCGCHDNRMDKVWWNEQWMGYPVGPHYAEQSNVTNAHKLRGKLLLVVGELDRNVDPASTMQVVNALVKAGKDFDFLIVPGAGHGAAESPYGKRRRMDFFVRHLLGVEPPDRNQN